MTKGNTGTIAWVDLTVTEAERLRDFYRQVVGWTAEDVDMGGYQDFNMLPPGSSEPAAGICHARGANARLPPMWLVYLLVVDLEASIAACREGGGEVIDGPRGLGPAGRFCVIRDPAGAVSALYEKRDADD
jgi:predicted enzyme related to lactoylglutathione lyase